MDDYAILETDVCEDGLMIGDMLYKNIVVPECEFMPDEVFEKIKPFIREFEKDAVAIRFGNMKICKLK